MSSWTADQIPDHSGRTIIVTGASSGIGAEAAEMLAGRGASVVLAVRSQAKGDATRDKIRARHRDADVAVSIVDLADLASIRAFAERETARKKIDVLINNAGLGMQPKRATTADGFERQFGTNHLGPFALTGLLLPALLRAEAPRVVAVASIAHRSGRMNFDDLQLENSYSGRKAYNQSKLANVLFALELDRRARHAGTRLTSVAAHPGVSSTGFVAASQVPAWQAGIFRFVVGVIGQDAAQGAAPLVHAAAMPDVKGGQYWGPDGFREIRGNPALAEIASHALDRGTAARLWAESERLTGVRYDALRPAT